MAAGDWTLTRLRAAVAGGEVSRARGVRRLPAPHRRRRRGDPRLHDGAGRGGPGARRGSGPPARRVARPPAARRPGDGQGRHLHARRPHDRLLADPGRLPPALRRDRGHAAARRGGRGHRQDQLRRVRHGLVDGALGARRHAQPVGAGPHSRRIERRRGGRGPPRAWRRRPLRPTPADRSASRRRCAASSGSSRPTGASRATVCWRSPRRWTRLARWR